MEVSQAYSFCPRCGAARSNWDPPRPFRCHRCEHTCFFGPVAAVGGVITNDNGQVLLLVRARDPGKGKLGVPGGFVDPWESAEEALRREAHEEVGIELENVSFLMTTSNRYSYQGIVHPVLDVYFSAQIKEEQSIAPELTEVADWMWSELTPSVLDQMAFDANRLALEHYLRILKHA